MPYSLIICSICDETSPPIVDVFIGSGTTLVYDWISIAVQLNLPLISDISERADSETNPGYRGEELVCLKTEMLIFERYWQEAFFPRGASEEFLMRIRKIIEGIELAIEHNYVLYVC